MAGKKISTLLVTGLLAIIGTVTGGVVKGYWDNELAKKNFQSQLILRALEPDDSLQRLKSLEFLVDVNLISDEKIKSGVKAVIKEGEENIPQFPSPPNVTGEARVIQENRELRKMVQGINSSDKTTRLATTDILKNKYAGNTEVIGLVLDFLNFNNLSALSAQGRVNVLFYLKNTDPSAWTPELIQQADEAIQRLEERHQNKIALIGDETRGHLNDFKQHLNTIKLN